VREGRHPNARFGAAQYGRQEERPDQLANQLAYDIARGVASAHCAGAQDANCDGWVPMPARQRPVREGERP
jgi:hypothetical protein